MQQSVTFFDRIAYNSPKTYGQLIHHAAEWYCSGSKKKVYVVTSAWDNSVTEGKIDSELKRTKDVWTAAKKVQRIATIASYFTIVIPLAMLLIKMVMRYKNQYRVIRSQEESSSFLSGSSSSQPTTPLKPQIGGAEDPHGKPTMLRGTVQSEEEASPHGDVKGAYLVQSAVSHRFDMKISKERLPFGSVHTAVKVSPGDTNASVKVTATGAEKCTPRSAKELIERYGSFWRDDGTFDVSEEPFDCDAFIAFLNEQTDQFKKSGFDPENHFGYIEKFELEPQEGTTEPAVYVRADLHGDLKSLCENLKALQIQGLLDDNFRCKKGVHLVFLGDYCDRGAYGLMLLEILMQLRSENRGSIHLIRGNHEDIVINRMYGRSDERLKQVLTFNSETDGERMTLTGLEALNAFYDTLPLSVYAGLKGEDGILTYVQFTHGLFEVTLDPCELLDQPERDFILVPKERKLSDRISRLAAGNPESALVQAAQRVEALAKQFIRLEADMTAYNWADIFNLDGFLFDESSWVENLSGRRCKIIPSDIRSYLDVSCETAKVAQIFRGHEHRFQHHVANGSVIATTLAVGVECAYYSQAFGQPDISYILSPNEESCWQKKVLKRDSKSSDTQVDGPYPLTFDETMAPVSAVTAQ